MKITLIGATGFVGTAVLNEAVNRGHEVIALARNPEKISNTSDHVTAKAIDINDMAALIGAIKGSDAVVSAFNAGWGNPNLYDDFLKGSKDILQAAKHAGVKRILVVGGAGSLEIAPGVQLVDTPEFPQEYKAGATAARDLQTIMLSETELDWTFLSPAIILHPGKRTGKFRLGNDNPVFDAANKSEISVEDMAVAIIDELENNQFVQKRFTLGY